MQGNGENDGNARVRKITLNKQNNRRNDSFRDKLNEGIAAYIGVSAPETPKYLLTNNFLLDYFAAPGDTRQAYDFTYFHQRGILQTEDNNEENQEKLQKSFDKFLRRYLGEDVIKQENTRLGKNPNKHYYFPFTQEMLTGSNPTLRHMLFYLQDLDDKFDYADMRKKLENYIFHDNSGINHILKILLQNQEEKVQYRERFSKEATETFWSMLETSAEHNRMKRLGRQLNEDLNTLLTHEYYGKLDFYRKYNYLSTLLTSYVIQYIVYRRDANMGMLCKGAPSDNRLSGVIHRACCNNYAEIRNLFPNLLQEYYRKAAEEAADEEGNLVCLADGNEVYIGTQTFQDFSTGVLGSRSRGGKNKIEYGRLVKAFNLEEGEKVSISVEDFVVRYINLNRTRRGSTLTKISSTLPTSGRQIEMVFPKNNAKHKYFAMSASLTEFYVRLYLARKNQQYDYLDNFLEDLQKRYRIIIAKPADGGKSLRGITPKLSAQEFARNKSVFLDTLNSVNCLIKLSDSGYVVTLPEEKGDFKLI